MYFYLTFILKSTWKLVRIELRFLMRILGEGRSSGCLQLTLSVQNRSIHSSSLLL